MAKTTLKVRVKAWQFFNEECKVAGLRRDDILNRSLPGELALLEKIPACDDVGEQWLKRNWVDHIKPDDIVLQVVPFQLSDDVVAGMNATCAKKRIPRDAFFNCFLDYAIQRIFDAAVVLKSLRTTKDIASQIIFQEIDNESQDHISDEDRNRFIQEAARDAIKGRELDYFKPDYYKQRLSFSAEKVEEIQIYREMFSSLKT